ncbi:MAG: type III-B CRISPR-associated protein Cas10/Cmr2 [Cyanobacteria bacterium P01_G01_bin.39]
MTNKPKYIAISFAPVQGFIEKSRKLRDLYGASRILSHLTYKLIEQIEQSHLISEIEIISPGIPTLQEGMPNRIVVRGYLDDREIEKFEQEIRKFILATWRNILKVCKAWIEHKFRAYEPDYRFYWDSQWKYWRQNTWEIFVGQGQNVETAMDDLETKKLARDWTALNWVGKSSSLTGTDAIIHPDINNRRHYDPRNKITPAQEEKVKKFYRCLSCFLEGKNPNQKKPEGKFLES